MQTPTPGQQRPRRDVPGIEHVAMMGSGANLERTSNMEIGIGELSRITGIKIPTIRYYEQIGLLAEGSRNKGNQRRYEHRAVHRLLFIRRARDLGFSIDAIRDLLRLADKSVPDSSEALRIAKEQLAAVEDKIAQLETLEKVMQLIADGEDNTNLAQCDILLLNDESHGEECAAKSSGKGRETVH
ncbi:MerR family transcriptional regulator [Pseudaminobacter sp. NGMCC 1.201702]|uniref:MerR family transcriptional regulator n=1 Tax=Pseudaminobacter sp. NGMCC 1.201702 TaxID=3391825 RepID=UPI0039F00EA4